VPASDETNSHEVRKYSQRNEAVEKPVQPSHPREPVGSLLPIRS
jgi:hypothetical protein